MRETKKRLNLYQYPIGRLQTVSLLILLVFIATFEYETSVPTNVELRQRPTSVAPDRTWIYAVFVVAIGLTSGLILRRRA